MPGIGRGELLARSNVENQISQRCLQAVQCKVEAVKGDDSDTDCGALDLYGQQEGQRRIRGATHQVRFSGVPVALSTTKEIHQRLGYRLCKRKAQTTDDQEDSSRDDPVSPSVL